jgi:DNA-binding beta-propeller fold protein YncE
LRSFGSAGSGSSQFTSGFCHFLAFDAEGNLVVGDQGNQRMQVLTYSDGAHVRTIGSKGSGKGQFQNPSGIAFDGAGHILVAEYGKNISRSSAEVQ